MKKPEVKPEDVNAWYNLGITCGEMGQYSIDNRCLPEIPDDQPGGC